MGRYQRAFEQAWDTLDKGSATERAYALGVAAATGEFHREELEAIRAEMDTSYKKSLVDLAYEEGKNEVKEYLDRHDGADDGAVWSTLVEGEPTVVDADDGPEEGRLGLPNALDKLEALEPPDRSRNEAVDRPDFLER
jgi:hypothetical protein